MDYNSVSEQLPLRMVYVDALIEKLHTLTGNLELDRLNAGEKPTHEQQHDFEWIREKLTAALSLGEDINSAAWSEDLMEHIFELAESLYPERVAAGEWLTLEAENKVSEIHSLLNQALGIDDPSVIADASRSQYS